MIPSPAIRARPAAFTVADGLMVLVGVLAAMLRVGQLTRLPLSPAEATSALANWQFWSAAPMTLPVASPAYFTFTNLVMALGGSGDAAARLVPVIFGLLTVLVPWLWRGRARPAVWLVSGLFLAVSPLLVAVSRTAGGDAIALFALMWLAVAGLNAAGGGRRWAAAAGAALGLGLASSPLFYSGLFALLPAVVIAQTFRPPVDSDVRVTAAARRGQLRDGAMAAAIAFLAVATGLLVYPAGLGAALRLFPEWLAQFGLPAGGDVFSPILALLRYEPAVMLLGIPALIWALLERDRPGRLLTFWLGLLGLIVLFQPGILTNAAAVLLPAYLLVGLLAAALAAQRVDYPTAGSRTTWAVAVALVGLGALMLTATGRFARLNLLAGQNATLIGLALLAFLLAGLAVMLAMAWENPAARRGAFIGATLLLIFWQWGAAWQLSRLGANDPRERWVTTGTDDDVRLMTGLLARVSRQTVNSDRDLTVFSQVDSPVLRWYLRDLAGFRTGPALPVNTQADVIITPVETEPALSNDYFGADFGLAQREIPASGPATAGDILKWWLFRESTAPVETQRVVVWIRSDLAGEE